MFGEAESADSASALPLDALDEELLRGSFFVGGKTRIYEYFRANHTPSETVAFLKKEYGTYGHSPLNGSEYWIDCAPRGITLTRGNLFEPDAQVTVSWTRVAERIRELISDGRYLFNNNANELDFDTVSRLALSRALADMDYAAALDGAASRASLRNPTAWAVEESIRSRQNKEPQIYDAYFSNSDFRERLLDYVLKESWKTRKTAETRDGAELARQVRAELYARGYVVSDELIETAIADYSAGLDGSYTDIAEYIEREYLTNEFVGNEPEEVPEAERAEINELLSGGKSYETTNTPEPPRTVDLSLPDPTWTVAELAEYGYTEPDMFPLSVGRAVELFDAGHTIYLLYPDNNKVTAIDRDEIITFSSNGFCGITKADWELSPIRDAQNKVYENIILNRGKTAAAPAARTPTERVRDNLLAIETLKTLEAENRDASYDERELLSRYVGWGGLADVFDEESAAPFMRDAGAELRKLLTPEEYAAARASTLTAFYTPPEIIAEMYNALETLNINPQNVLEPSCGIGSFFRQLPVSFSGAELYGAELDSVSARIAQKLYPKANIRRGGFENTDFPDDFFDLAIGNVPFGDYGITDRRYDNEAFLIHDYFFAKTLDLVKPGGVVAFITSKGTMDKQNSNVRRYIAERAELIGAVRLPNTAFKAEAGTDVTSDIIFLQKRERPIELGADTPDWVHRGRVPSKSYDFEGRGEATERSGFAPIGGRSGAQSATTTDDNIPLNEYFIAHPEMILGEMKMVSGRFGAEYVCVPIEGEDLRAQLRRALAELPALKEIAAPQTYAPEQKGGEIPADPNVRDWSFTIHGGEVYYRTGARMSPVKVNATAERRIRAMLALRAAVRNIIQIQLDSGSDDELAAAQAQLTREYEKFSGEFGLVNSRANSIAFGNDAGYYLLCALEIVDDESGEFLRRSDIFTRRTIRAYEPITSADSAADALAVSLNERGYVDLDYMSELTRKDRETLLDELRGVVFLNVGNADSQGKTYVTADEYLSGNVREKLRLAEAAAITMPELQINIDALKVVQPIDLTPGEIEAGLGSAWIPEDVVKDFIIETLEVNNYYMRKEIKVIYSKYTGDWFIEGKNRGGFNIKATVTYGTERVSAYKLIEDALNLRATKLYDNITDADGNERRVLNRVATSAAQAKQDELKERFKSWLWENPERRERLTTLYNERFNSIRPREYDGSGLIFPGMSPEVRLEPYQMNAVARQLYGGNTLLAHVVGAGKTYEIIAGTMEAKRLGISSKAMVVVPNHLIGQWASKWIELYPAAELLVATEKDFETKNRKKFCARIAAGSCDAVIIGHSQFEKIPVSKERQEDLINREIYNITQGIEELKRQRGERYTVKQLESAKAKLLARLKKLNDQTEKDNVLNFEELGVDRLCVDEADFYKNLYAPTKMRNVAGIAQTEAMKASDMYAKCRYLDELTGGRGIVFATGTPISNTMTEMFTMQRYLQYDKLEDLGLNHFDSWASTFGETVNSIELKPEGSGFRQRTRFARFFNLPELMQIFKETADIQTADMLKLPVPEAEFVIEKADPSEFQSEILETLADRAEAVRSGDIDPSVDNMLLITNDGRKLALDQRLIDPALPDFEGSKVNLCVKRVFEQWQSGTEGKLTQIVFCDLSTPKNDRSFDVYNDMKRKLIAKGVPAEEIAFIHDFDTTAKKESLYAKVRAGTVRVIFGSTAKLGAGTNIQDRLIAIHDLDCPWRPRDLEQRAGRIIRRGNTNDNVRVHRYITSDTFDAYLYQTLENKQKFISQIMTSKVPVRSCEDVDESVLTYAEIKAIATGNPLIKEKMELDVEVARLKLAESAWKSEHWRLESAVGSGLPGRMSAIRAGITSAEADIKLTELSADSEFYVTIDDKDYTDKTQAGYALLALTKAAKSPHPKLVGEFRGFPLELSYETFGEVWQLILKGAGNRCVELGDSVTGNIQRIENALERIPATLEKLRGELSDTERQLENAKHQLKVPFARAGELAEKQARLRVLEAELKLNEHGAENIIGDENSEPAAPKRTSAGARNPDLCR
jgi:N12 class adenine-specific DNA methylase